MPSRARHAVYWAPEDDDPLWAAGCRWLGRDPRTQSPVQGRPEAAAAARYGFHATLKAPIRLASPDVESAFMDDVATLAAATPRFALPALRIAWLDDFLALRPVTDPAPGDPLRRLADACVRELDRWRTPAGAEESARRVAALRDASARDALERWGYPHVFTHWRFHLTLSEPMPAGDLERRAAVEHDAQQHFGSALAPARQVQSLAVFVQPDDASVFRLACRCPLGAPP